MFSRKTLSLALFVEGKIQRHLRWVRSPPDSTFETSDICRKSWPLLSTEILDARCDARVVIQREICQHLRVGIWQREGTQMLRQWLVGIEIVQGHLATTLRMVLPCLANPAFDQRWRALLLSVHQYASIVEDGWVAIIMHERLMLLTAFATLGAIEHLWNDYTFEPPFGQIQRCVVVIRMAQSKVRASEHFIRC